MATFHNLGAYQVCTTDAYPQTKRVQFRFPRSKKKRIRAKWAKRPGNWRDVACDDVMFDRERGIFYCHTSTWERMKVPIEQLTTKPAASILSDPLDRYNRFMEPVPSIDEVKRMADRIRSMMARGRA